MLPKEKQTAYQRWELASFGQEEAAAPAAAPGPTPAMVEDFARQLAAAREQGRAEGHAEGLRLGREEGLQQGRATAEQERQQLARLAAAFGAELERLNENVAQDLLDFGLDLSKAMLKSALAVRPDLVLHVIAETIRYLPSVQQPALLFLHPADAELARAQMAEELTKAGWRIVPEPRMERGGCRVETASNEIDASAPLRWQRLAAALGRDGDWLA